MGKRGPNTAEGRARSLANLRPYKPGECGNPRGRPFGESSREKLNDYAGMTEAEVKVIAESPTATMAERSAAKQALRMLEAGAEWERGCNQTGGTPAKTVNMNLSGGVEHAHTVQAALDRMRTDPEAMRQAIELGRRLRPAAHDGPAGSN